MPTMATSSAEMLQAQPELWPHSFAYLKSMALYTAVKLGIPDSIHRCGGAASLPDLLAGLTVPPNKRPYLPRLMEVLAAAGIFTVEHVPAAAGEGDTTATGCGVCRLTPVSRLLVDDDAGINGGACLSRFVLMAAGPSLAAASARMHQWFQGEEDEAATAFAMAHDGGDFYSVAARDAEFNAASNEGMGSDSRFTAELVVRECGEVFTGITSLVDVGGGNGAMATAIAEAFPHVRCSVLDLPQVVEGISADDTVEFVAGDMMEFIPPADAILLKSVLHNWNDEDCVKVLTRCREAVSLGPRAGKVIIIDTVVGSASEQICEAQLLMDMCMMMLFTGKERGEQNWKKIIMEAGFSLYEIRPILGVRSVIEVYP